ncbi:hypothetical protein C8245_11640 [Paracidovorax avenae]|nr:RHS repeat-associated core domain-containing protein [Paracidovorax avenae]AVS66239.1 hypothetical protein C8245_11640 [Paracidovorax avenae]
MRFQGQQFDAETGLHYNRFRYYDPMLGQYVTQDPIGLQGGLNKTCYPENPLTWVDPLGLNPISASKGVDLEKGKDWFDKIKDIFDFRENVQEGREIKREKDLLMCRAEKEMNERVKNDQMTPEAGKMAGAAKEVSVSAAGPASNLFEIVMDKDWITGAAKVYGYITAPAKDYAILLAPTNSAGEFDFFKK